MVPNEDIGVDLAMINQINDMQKEILGIGWKGILQKYHPDVRMTQDAFEVFELYKEMYESMKNRILIEVIQ